MAPTIAIHGAFTALITPFTADGAVDEAAYRALAAWQVLAGIDGLVPVGTTGEAPTLSAAERDRLIEIAVAAAGERRGPTRPLVVAGTGTNDTRASIDATRRAAAIGADAALVVAPYYNRPDQRMLDAHFRAIADEGGLPIVVYNVPSRTGANVEADDGQAALVGDGAEVGIEHPLVGLVVVGRDDERRVRAEGGGPSGGVDRGAGVVGAGAGDDRDAGSDRRRALGHGLDGDLDAPVALGGGEGGRLAGGPDGDEAVDPGDDLPGAQARDRRPRRARRRR